MDPRIQYARTKDGVSIAFYAIGEGRPIVAMPSMPISHLQLEWQVLETRASRERAASTKKLIRYDGRGSGLSERRISNYSLDALLLDLEAVADHLALDTFAISASNFAGPPAIAYAARHPGRVSHLVLLDAAARGEDLWLLPFVQGFRALIEKDWGLASEAFAHFVRGWSDNETSRQYAAVVRESTTSAEVLAFLDFARSLDVSHLLGDVRCPTLVIQSHSEEFGGSDRISMARGLASRIVGASMLVLEGGVNDARVVAARDAAIGEFLGGGQAAMLPARPRSDPFRTVLFTDIEGSTGLTQRLGDAGAQNLLRAHNTIVRDALRSCDGNEIKHTGDGIMASFPSASRALDCAIAIQRAVGEKAETPFRVRVGVNAGEPVAEERDLFGTAVQLARRICDQAEGGQILVSNVVRELVSGKDFLFADTGEVALKGFQDPVRLYELRWREDG